MPATALPARSLLQRRDGRCRLLGLGHVCVGAAKIGNPRHNMGSVRHRRSAIDGKRVLISIPIIHSEADMGGLARSIRRVTVRKLGRRAWKRNVDVIARMWDDLRRTAEGWDLPWEKVRLYQDGLPRCGREVDLVTTLAGAGSPNHQLLLSLMSRGAPLAGTESPDLLVKEYRLVQEQLAANDSRGAATKADYEARSRALLARRDRYIARRINESLLPGELGLLFLGMLHSVEPYLAKDIEVRHPIRWLPRPRTLTT